MALDLIGSASRIAIRTVIRRVVSTGLHDELPGEAFAVIDVIDGRAH